ncbi:hypothetical protein PR048_010359 [Dryococelus australis]|uniref:Uncharacterized protein n=1 Tax=Dryococelus australis TaxID=614101 RepID=A0ABQ9I2G7_9NEOP|nr:hypothetical protein PR048_010359 [Dryococelus australis]
MRAIEASMEQRRNKGWLLIGCSSFPLCLSSVIGIHGVAVSGGGGGLNCKKNKDGGSESGGGGVVRKREEENVYLRERDGEYEHVCLSPPSCASHHRPPPFFFMKTFSRRIGETSGVVLARAHVSTPEPQIHLRQTDTHFPAARGWRVALTAGGDETPLVHTVFDTSWRILENGVQMSPFIVIADYQCTDVRSVPDTVRLVIRHTNMQKLLSSAHVPYVDLPTTNATCQNHLVNTDERTVRIVPDDAADRRVFSGISRFPPTSIPALPHTRLNISLIGCQDFAVKSRPNLFTHSIHSILVWQLKWFVAGVHWCRISKPPPLGFPASMLERCLPPPPPNLHPPASTSRPNNDLPTSQARTVSKQHPDDVCELSAATRNSRRDDASCTDAVVPSLDPLVDGLLDDGRRRQTIFRDVLQLKGPDGAPFCVRSTGVIEPLFVWLIRPAGLRSEPATDDAAVKIPPHPCGVANSAADERSSPWPWLTHVFVHVLPEASLSHASYQHSLQLQVHSILHPTVDILLIACLSAAENRMTDRERWDRICRTFHYADKRHGYQPPHSIPRKPQSTSRPRCEHENVNFGNADELQNSVESRDGEKERQPAELEFPLNLGVLLWSTEF